MDPGSQGWDVELDVPCRPSYARVVRTAAAACGVLEGFSVDLLGDVRLLVDEVFTAMTDAGVDRVRLRFAPSDGRLAVSIEASAPAPTSGHSDLRFVRSLADIVADGVDFGLERERPAFAATISRDVAG
jgi:hypothetical protein